MKKSRKLLLLTISLLMLGSLFPTSALAGKRTYVSNLSDSTGQIKESDWNKTDENVVCTDGKLIISADSSTADTKFISKAYSVSDDSVEDMITAAASLTITDIPEGEKFILAFGMRGIEAAPGDTGNIETCFVNDGGLKVSVAAYGDEGKVMLAETKSAGISFHTRFQFTGSITSKGVQTIKINGQTIYQGQLPVSGEGRFGVIQTGGCGAEFSELMVQCSYYDRPENTDIFEDFENSEFNINELVATANSNGMGDMNMRIEEYNGNKVLMFRNVGLSWLGTTHTYSNFELSFDVPYFLRQNIYDTEGNHLYSPTQRISIGFGEESQSPEIGNEYLTDVDLIDIGSNYLSSRLAQKFVVDLSNKGFFDVNSESDGFSVKFSVIDGMAEVYMKKLSDSTWTLVANTYYEEFRSGYIYLWVTESANFALDNFALINKDKDPNLVDVDYTSSVITAEDYSLTEEETALTFRPERQQEQSRKENIMLPVLIGFGCMLIILLTVISIFVQKKCKGGLRREE